MNTVFKRNKKNTNSGKQKSIIPESQFLATDYTCYGEKCHIVCVTVML